MPERLKVLVVGAGMMARAVAYDLVRQEDVAEVLIADKDHTRLTALKRLLRSRKVRTFLADAGDRARMTALMRPCNVAVSCVPYFYNLGLTRAAIATKTHFCDLGGNNTVVHRQLALDRQARRAGVTVIPDCGLAPGMVSVLAADGCSRLDRCDEIHLRVGGLPRCPQPPLDYGLVFSANGLINEYVEPCLVLREGKVAQAEPLADVEDIRFPLPFGRLEAFNTSGGSSTLPFTFRGRVRTLDYKTIRYPGHCAKVRLLFDLGLTDLEPEVVDGRKVVPRHLLIQRLEAVLPVEKRDVVLLRVVVKGVRQGRKRTIRYQLVDYSDPKTGLTAMMRTTGFPAAVVALMLGRGQAAQTGALPGEQAIPSGAFIAELLRRDIRLQVRAS